MQGQFRNQQEYNIVTVNRYNFLLEQSRCRHCSTVIAEHNGNPKALNTFKRILHKILNGGVPLEPTCQ